MTDADFAASLAALAAVVVFCWWVVRRLLP